MNVIPIYAHNAGRNISYLIDDNAADELIVVDPYDVKAIVEKAYFLKKRITRIINTHDHWDHTLGNDELIKATGATVLAHPDANIKMDKVLDADSKLSLGDSTIKVLDTPGHTLSHICLLINTDSALISGDTLFNAGAGNCLNGGNVDDLYQSFAQLQKLPMATKLYPGHDYLKNNCQFTLSLEPDNKEAKAWLLQAARYPDAPEKRITTIACEKAINLFFRLDKPAVQQAIRKACHNSKLEQAKDYFIALRQCRNKW